MQATDAGRRAKRDDYSIRSPEPGAFLLSFLHPSISYSSDSWLRRSNLPALHPCIYTYLPPIRWRWAIDAWVRVLCPVCPAL